MALIQDVWIPKSVIISEEKQWIDRESGEFIMIYDLPDWYVDRNNLSDYVYRNGIELYRHIQKIKRCLNK